MILSPLKPPLSFPSVSGSIVTFNSQYAGLPLKSHKVAVTATQSGSGTPSPSNPRSINGYSAININHSDADTSNPTVYTIQIGSTVYGGEYDARTGVLTVTKASVILDSSKVPTSEAYVQYNSATDVYSWTYDHILVGVTNQANVICDKLSLSADAYNRTSGGKFYCTTGLSERIYVSMEGSVVGSKAGMIQWLRDNTPLFVYELATPTTIQLPPCPIDTLLGENNIWADTGDTTLQYPKFG